MTHGSLFSGIGGAELAASWMGWKNLFHCEIDPFCNKVLNYWFPKSKSYENIKKTDFSEWKGKIDIITGGFPCQPFSSSGKRKGDTDDRYLWPEMLRAIREIQPAWVVGENVAGITSMVESGEDIKMGHTDDIFEENYIYRKEQQFTIERVCKDLESIGYSVQPVVIPACAVGAPHRRDRVWFIAHNKSFGRNKRRTACKVKTSEKKIRESFRSNVNGFGGEQPIANCNNAGVKSKQKREKQICKPKPTTNTECSRSQQIHNKDKSKKSNGDESNRKSCKQSITNTCCERQKSRNGSESVNFSTRHTAKSLHIKPDWEKFPTQPPVCRGNDGLPFRVDDLTISFSKWRQESIKGYGNAWVPQVAYQIFKAIAKEQKIKTVKND